MTVSPHSQSQSRCRCFPSSSASFSSHPPSSSCPSRGWRRPGSWGHVGRTSSPSPYVRQPAPKSGGKKNEKRKLLVQLSDPDEPPFQSVSLVAHHNGEDDGSHCRLEDPQESQTQALDKGEEVDTSLGDVPQVDQVRLVFGWHQEQLQTVHKLKKHKVGNLFSNKKESKVTQDD